MSGTVNGVGLAEILGGTFSGNVDVIGPGFRHGGGIVSATINTGIYTLAGGTVDEIEEFPVWVERKYDGIRLMLHKSTDARGSVLFDEPAKLRDTLIEYMQKRD